MAVVDVKQYNGMLFHDLAVTTSPVITEVAVDHYRKFVVERPLSLQIHTGAYQYNSELLLSTWSRSYPKLQPRGVQESDYWRSEQILCSVEDLHKVRELKDFFFECFTTCDSILKGLQLV